MSPRARFVARAGALLFASLLVAGIAAPFLSAQRFGNRIRASLEKALGRRVEIQGEMHFSLLTGPGFRLEKVIIHEDPSMGIEPFAHVGTLKASPRLLPLLAARLEFASVRLDDASVNLVKTGPASEPGRWNFEPMLNRTLLATFPKIRVLGRINFKFGDTKSIFYLTDTDLDISPPGRGESDWNIRFEGAPARTDRPAHGFGTMSSRGRWNQRTGQIDLDLRLDRNNLGEIIALIYGRSSEVHGELSSRLRLSGPPDQIAIRGTLEVADIHRWDMSPARGGVWPFSVQGRLNLPAQTLDLESNAAAAGNPPLSVRFRVSNYLTQPRWGVAANWNRFPIDPIIEIAAHMGVRLPPGVKLAGAFDGAMGFQTDTGLQGELAFHDSSLTITDSPPIRFEQAQLLFKDGHVHLSPALVKTANGDQATLEIDYLMASRALNLNISTETMDVASLRSQVSLAAVPWLEQVRAGRWGGQLRYQAAPDAAGGWSGRISLKDADVPIPGLAEPLRLESASAQIQDARVNIDRIAGDVGNIRFRGEYRYEPQVVRPHRFRVAVAELDGAELERVLAPTLRRSSGLFARALGRATVPDWLRTRHVDGTVQVGEFALGDLSFSGVQGHLVWDGPRVEIGNVQARLEKATVQGQVTAILRGSRPAYRITGQLRGLEWNGGELDSDSVIETSGSGEELLSRMRSEGTFNARHVEIGSLEPFRTVSGAFEFAWPRLRLADLQLDSAGETFTGRGATQDDGRLLVVLTNGSRELRVTGPLAQLRLDQIE